MAGAQAPPATRSYQTSQLHLVRIPLSTNSLGQWAGERGWVRGRAVAFDEGRALHHLVDETFGPGALRPFRFLVPPRAGEGNLYSYSAHSHEELVAAMRKYALPEHLAVLRPERLASKPMPVGWRVGERIGFDVRLRPVRRLRADLTTPLGKFRAGAELDAYLWEALRHYPADREGMAASERSRASVYLDWLDRRFAHAAQIDRAATRMIKYERIVVARGARALDGPDVIFHGTLTVTQPDAFTAILAHGVGRHRAFGYGMLLVRPPHRTAPIRFRVTGHLPL